ncbi:uncharacterized protein PHACADRAFT_194951 [Phanerochaete carnosa HHB-10118-sp]|uniref:NmrA-like domain-containing protein n=1 Tax=Phanerochaete carnosa (strain HHB-10118-sp) TaxID=650164 RepID=K5WDQ8_PHACS|nr:uncharacterized protein PHACADRAFT_194951 [Phanerochaete carnosa HHB-10118-sp]EKM57405.1 hypothetical protein PHACADRAFT_194951 [Phanerochaete carnosa HHB-10118-sp]
MASRKILVVGATDRQGGTFARAATEAPKAEGALENGFHFVALTHNASSPSVRELAPLSDHVSSASANLNNANTVRKVFEDERAKSEGGTWGVFMVLALPGLGVDGSGEEVQGKLVTNLACEYNVQHFLCSSSDHARDSRDEHATLSHLAKVNIEKNIKSKQGLSWTIICPVYFIEMFEGLVGRVTFSVVRSGLKKDTKLQLVVAADIGRVACVIMRSPDTYDGQ